jgi:hypothetical protein
VLIDLPSCLNTIKGGNSLFGDYYKYCESLSESEKSEIPLLLDFDPDDAVYGSMLNDIVPSMFTFMIGIMFAGLQ